MKCNFRDKRKALQCTIYALKMCLTVFLVATLISLFSCSFFSVTAKPVAESPAVPQSIDKKPNVIVILVDDLGYGELGVYGGDEIPTPHIDSIARNGIRFTNGYVSCPVCSPTRAGLMMGRYQQRFGHEFNPGGGPPNFGLPPTEVTIAERMKSLGYVTGMVGKWHLGNSAPSIPTKRGFDEFFGFLGGAHQYFGSNPAANNPILRGTEVVQEKEYLTDAFTREAVAFIERHKSEPFFLYLAYNAVHSPLQAPEKYLNRFNNLEGKRHTFAAMLSAMDDGVGQILSKLRDLKIEEKTLVVYLSDNGGPTAQTTSRNDPLRGFKGQVLEGGIRIPFMIQWSGQVPAGKVYDEPVISLDILPTAIAAAGGKIQEDWNLDGVNLIPYLRGEIKSAPHDTLFWRFGDQWAVRRGTWKLVKESATTAPKLFNLAEDVHEDNDLAAQYPVVVKELKALYDEWDSQLVEPSWKKVKKRAKPAIKKQIQ